MKVLVKYRTLKQNKFNIKFGEEISLSITSYKEFIIISKRCGRLRILDRNGKELANTSLISSAGVSGAQAYNDKLYAMVADNTKQEIIQVFHLPSLDYD